MGAPRGDDFLFAELTATVAVVQSEKAEAEQEAVEMRILMLQVLPLPSPAAARHLHVIHTLHWLHSELHSICGRRESLLQP